MKKGNKKAQAYLMATIIIIGIVISIVTITNYSLQKKQINIYDYAEELRIEGEKVLDYETTTSESEFDDFAEKYSAHVGNEKEIYYIVGTNSSMSVFTYEGANKESQSFTKSGNDLTVSLDDNDYVFEINSGRNFHFIMLENRDGEQYVVTSRG